MGSTDLKNEFKFNGLDGGLELEVECFVGGVTCREVVEEQWCLIPEVSPTCSDSLWRMIICTGQIGRTEEF